MQGAEFKMQKCSASSTCTTTYSNGNAHYLGVEVFHNHGRGLSVSESWVGPQMSAGIQDRKTWAYTQSPAWPLLYIGSFPKEADSSIDTQ